MHARYYSAHLGRFTSPDPEDSAKPLRPQTWNKYAYVRANPLKFIDPDGGQEGAALRQDRLTQQLIDGEITRDEYNARLRADAGAAVFGTAGVVAGLAAAEVGPTLSTLARSMFLRPEVQLTAAQIVGSFADDLQSGGGASSLQVFTKLTEAPQAGRALSAAAGQGGQGAADAARESGRLFAAKFPKALITKLEQAGLVERRLTMMNGKVAIELRFSEEATEELAQFFREIPPE